MRPLRSVIALVLPALVGAAPALAQQVGPGLTPEGVRTCLCLEEAMATHKAEMELRSGIFRERESELERIGMDIEVKRASMNPDDAQAIADLKVLIERQQTLRQLLRRDIQPSYQDSVASFNAVTSAYNEQCAGRRLDKAEVERLQGNLQCPALP
jgi:hypothetical protein